MYEDSQGMLWIGSESGLYLFDRKLPRIHIVRIG
ncbi:MAG: hypothetical protein ICV79_12085 [Flavisolibacter sp.]|nr:hypothetical protein [Flavisolibacter sp.]